MDCQKHYITFIMWVDEKRSSKCYCNKKKKLESFGRSLRFVRKKNAAYRSSSLMMAVRFLVTTRQQ